MSAARSSSRLATCLLPLLLASACGASPDAPPETADSRAGDSGVPAGLKPRGDGELDSLATLRERLRSAGDTKELDLAAKGWGAELGRVLGGADSLAKLEKLDVSDNELGPE